MLVSQELPSRASAARPRSASSRRRATARALLGKSEEAAADRPLRPGLLVNSRTCPRDHLPAAEPSRRMEAVTVASRPCGDGTTTCESRRRRPRAYVTATVIVFRICRSPARAGGPSCVVPVSASGSAIGGSSPCTRLTRVCPVDGDVVSISAGGKYCLTIVGRCRDRHEVLATPGANPFMMYNDRFPPGHHGLGRSRTPARTSVAPQGFKRIRIFEEALTLISFGIS